MSRRMERIGDQVCAELNRLLLREVHDPRVRLATVSRVVVSADLQHARVFVSSLGSDEERDGSVAALNHARGFLRSRLASALSLRRVPELRFELDRGAEHSLHISELLSHVEPDPS